MTSQTVWPLVDFRLLWTQAPSVCKFSAIVVVERTRLRLPLWPLFRLTRRLASMPNYKIINIHERTYTHEFVSECCNDCGDSEWRWLEARCLPFATRLRGWLVWRSVKSLFMRDQHILTDSYPNVTTRSEVDDQADSDRVTQAQAVCPLHLDSEVG